MSIHSAPPMPHELLPIPAGYQQVADQKGTLVELPYSTWESGTYKKKSKRLAKRAIVYLPYGYSEEKKYNAFYLMHGGLGYNLVYPRELP